MRREDARTVKRRLLILGQMLELSDWKNEAVDVFKEYFNGRIKADSIGISYQGLYQLMEGLESDGIVKQVKTKSDLEEFGFVDSGGTFADDISISSYVITASGLIWICNALERRVSLDELGKGFKAEFKNKMKDIVYKAALVDKLGNLREGSVTNE